MLRCSCAESIGFGRHRGPATDDYLGTIVGRRSAERGRGKMRQSRFLLLVAVLMTASGCAESALIRSNPEGANVFVDDQLIGTTPVTFTVPRSELADSYRLRVEKDGY